ncbi:MAG TPA: RICIN domain-containing protein [Actinokineospora sp.]|jgi:hypothetical protein|nr:RICIN domain-containing protein [Actinokineospora sp.]
MSISKRRGRVIACGAILSVLTAGAVSLVVTAPAGAVGGNVAESWSIPNVPSTGLTNITFPMTVNPETAHITGTYFAQQYRFKNAANVGYIGLQPLENRDGRERLHATFSTFQGGSSTTDSGFCKPGADGGPGVSCKSEFDAVYGHIYALTIARTGADTWTGTATDTVTGVANHIGTYKMPAGSGNLSGYQIGFVEYYRQWPTCSQLPRTDVFFGGPTSTDGNLTGTSRAGYEYSQCIGQANYKAVNVGNGVHITRGWLPGGTPTGAAIKNTGSGRCLDDPAGNTANGTRIVIQDCTGAANQKWTTTAAKAVTIGGKCLDAYGAGTSPGTNAILWDCHGGTNQQWTFPSDGTIRGVQSGLCLAPSGTSTANGTAVVLATCSGQAIQRWTRG